MQPIVIKINGIDYTSVGKYMDNNDGIFHYLPEQSVDNWVKFLEFENPIIKLWLLSGLQYDNYISSSFEKSIIESGGNKLILFLKKYCWESSLNDIFIDFIFGCYSDFGEEEFPEIYHKGKLVEHEDFEFSDHVFIETIKYDEFKEDLYCIINLIIRKLRDSEHNVF